MRHEVESRPISQVADVRKSGAAKPRYFAASKKKHAVLSFLKLFSFSI
jgi:hypothetical protein